MMEDNPQDEVAVSFLPELQSVLGALSSEAAKGGETEGPRIVIKNINYE